MKTAHCWKRLKEEDAVVYVHHPDRRFNPPPPPLDRASS